MRESTGGGVWGAVVWSWDAAAALTVTLALPVMLLVTVSVAVTVWLPAVTKVTLLLKVWAPLSPDTKDRKSGVEGKRVDLGGGRIIKKKKTGAVLLNGSCAVT